MPNNALKSEVALARDVVENNTASIERAPHDVSKHIRNLPYGFKASTEKIATAGENGYVLNEGQTWVKNYRTGESA